MDKEKMVITKYNADDFVYYNKSTYHKQCFEQAISKHKKDPNVIKDILEKSKTHINHMLITDDLYRFMLDSYDLTVIENKVFQKLQRIYDGTFGGMSVGITAVDLLDMWQRKIKYLNKVHKQNITKGKVIEGNSRILYDLSVLINKYDSYLQWKREQKILEANTVSNVDGMNKQKIDYGVIEKQAKKKEDSSSADNINELLEEMF